MNILTPRRAPTARRHDSRSGCIRAAVCDETSIVSANITHTTFAIAVESRRYVCLNTVSRTNAIPMLGYHADSIDGLVYLVHFASASILTYIFASACSLELVNR